MHRENNLYAVQFNQIRCSEDSPVPATGLSFIQKSIKLNNSE